MTNEGISNFEPLRDRVLLKRVEVQERTPAGVIIPDTAQEIPAEGKVLAVGPGATDETGKLRPPAVRIGDRVLFARSAGTELLIDGEDRLILDEGDIFGIIKGNAHVSVKEARSNR
jgi:chaperonin GroES